MQIGICGGGICRYKTFCMRIFERTTFLLLRLVYMVNCVFWRSIPLEIEFKSRGQDSYAQRHHP